MVLPEFGACSGGGILFRNADAEEMNVHADEKKKNYSPDAPLMLPLGFINCPRKGRLSNSVIFTRICTFSP